MLKLGLLGDVSFFYKSLKHFYVVKNARHGWRQQCVNRGIKDVLLYFLKTFYFIQF